MTYDSNAGIVITDLIGKLNSLKNNSAMVREAATTVYANNLRRVHNQGQTFMNQPIGKYSTKATLIGASSFITKGAANKALGSKAKRRKLAWVTIGGRKLAVLPGGYKEIRNLEGKETSHVNLNRTGTLMDDFGIQAIGKDYVIGFKTEYGKSLRKHLEAHFNKKIWGASNADHEMIDIIAKKHIDRELK